MDKSEKKIEFMVFTLQILAKDTLKRDRDKPHHKEILEMRGDDEEDDKKREEERDKDSLQVYPRLDHT